MVPSGIERDGDAPLRIRRLENGTVVVEDAYEGRYTYTGNLGRAIRITGLRVASSGDEGRRP